MIHYWYSAGYLLVEYSLTADIKNETKFNGTNQFFTLRYALWAYDSLEIIQTTWQIIYVSLPIIKTTTMHRWRAQRTSLCVLCCCWHLSAVCWRWRCRWLNGVSKPRNCIQPSIFSLPSCHLSLPKPRGLTPCCYL